MSLAADKKRWDDLHAALAKAIEAKDEFDRQLHRHYGRYEDQWLTKTQRAKLAALRAKEDKIGEKIFELVERISPRDWSYGVPTWWVRRDLTWEDAIRPKSEPLSVVVPGSYGSRDGTVKERGVSAARGELFFVRDGYLIVEQTITGPKDRLFYVPLEYQLFHEDGRPVDWPGLREMRGTRTGNIIVVGNPHTDTNLEEFHIANDATSESKDFARGFQAALADRTWHKEGQGKKHYANSQKWWDGYDEGHRAKRSTAQESRTVMAQRSARKNTPESAGSEYATDQIQSDYFMGWVRDQMLEASKADPSEMLPLETKADARVIANNMLKQLEWDTKRELRGQELTNLIGSVRGEPRPSDVASFYDGFRQACDNSRDWLADELLTIKGEMGGGVEESRRVGALKRDPKDPNQSMSHARNEAQAREFADERHSRGRSSCYALCPRGMSNLGPGWYIGTRAQLEHLGASDVRCVGGAEERRSTIRPPKAQRSAVRRR